VLLIDAKMLAHATKHATVGTDMSEVQVLNGMLHGYLLRVLDLLLLYPVHRPLFFWDGHKWAAKNQRKSTTLLRSQVFPDYKQGREVADEPKWFTNAFEYSTLLIEVALREIGFSNHFEEDGYEADDLIAVMSRELTIAGKQSIIVSTDKDLYQLLGPMVIQHNPLSGKMMTDEYLMQEFGVTPEQWPMVKALMGDKGDNIPGIEHVGIKTACGLVRGEPPRSKKHPVQSLATMGAEHVALVNRNLGLMKLPYPGTPVPDIRDDAFSFYNLLHTLEKNKLHFHLKSETLDKWRTALEI